MEGNNNEVDKDAKPSLGVRFRTTMGNIGQFIFNTDTHEVLGRGGLSWLKILSFYIAFYAILAGFWAACMAGFLKTLDGTAPTMQKMFSMLKDNPGMNYEPFSKDNTSISFNSKDNRTYSAYFARLNDIYNVYKNETKNISSEMKQCSYENGANTSHACLFNTAELGRNCTPENEFGYRDGRPCVILRINKIYRWDPKDATFNSAVCMNPPSDDKYCDKHKEFLSPPTDKWPKKITSEIEPYFISVSCEGESDWDRDNLKNVTFHPSGGFPAFFYPYYNQPSYMSPLVMAQFDVIPGRLTMILCRIWTHDIQYDRNDLQGSIHFELLVDKKES